MRERDRDFASRVHAKVAARFFNVYCKHRYKRVFDRKWDSACTGHCDGIGNGTATALLKILKSCHFLLLPTLPPQNGHATTHHLLSSARDL